MKMKHFCKTASKSEVQSSIMFKRSNSVRLFARSTLLRKRFLHVIPHSAYLSLPVPDFFTQRKITMWKPTNVQDFLQKRTTATASAISATATTAGASTATVLLLLLSWFLNPATQSFPTKLRHNINRFPALVGPGKGMPRDQTRKLSNESHFRDLHITKCYHMDKNSDTFKTTKLHHLLNNGT